MPVYLPNYQLATSKNLLIYTELFNNKSELKKKNHKKEAKINLRSKGVVPGKNKVTK